MLLENLESLGDKCSAAAAKSLQSCLTLCDPIDGSSPGSPVPGILQARTLEWVAISFSNARKWKVKVKSLSHVRLLATPWTVAHQAPLSMGFSRQRSTGVGCHCLLRKSALLRVFFMFSIPDLLDFKSNSHLSQNLECYLFILGCCLRESSQLPTCSDQRTMLGDGFYH